MISIAGRVHSYVTKNMSYHSFSLYSFFSRRLQHTDFVLFEDATCLVFVTVLFPHTVETHLTTTSLRRPPLLKTTFWSERNIFLYFMFNFASLIRPVSYRGPHLKTTQNPVPNVNSPPQCDHLMLENVTIICFNF